MKTYLADIIPKLQRYGQKLDNLTLLENQHWVLLNEISQSKRVYIFRQNNQLLISENGIVEKGTWEYLGNQALLIETRNGSYLLKHGFFDENIIALKLDSTDNYAFFINETKYDKDLNTLNDILNFLENKYLQKEKKLNDSVINNKTDLNVKFGYTIISEKEKYDIAWGNFINYEIQFSNGKIENVYKGKKSEKYFYFDFTFGKIYCNDFEDAVYKAFIYNNKFNK